MSQPMSQMVGHNDTVLQEKGVCGSQTPHCTSMTSRTSIWLAFRKHHSLFEDTDLPASIAPAHCDVNSGTWIERCGWGSGWPVGGLRSIRTTRVMPRRLPYRIVIRHEFCILESDADFERRPSGTAVPTAVAREPGGLLVCSHVDASPEASVGRRSETLREDVLRAVYRCPMEQDQRFSRPCTL